MPFQFSIHTGVSASDLGRRSLSVQKNKQQYVDTRIISRISASSRIRFPLEAYIAVNLRNSTPDGT